MDSQEKENIGKAVLSIIEHDFLDDLTQVMGLLVSKTECVPEQANNEVRNALNHLARAYTAENPSEADDNLSKARSHIERAKRDCLKIILIYSNNEIERLMHYCQERCGFIHDRHVIKHREIQIKRRKIYVEETNGKQGVLTSYEGLITELNELQQELILSYGYPDPDKIKRRRRFRHIRKWILGAVSAVFFSLIASFVFAASVPDATLVRKLMMEGLSLLGSFLSQSAPTQVTGARE